MELYSRIMNNYSALIGRENHKTPEDMAFEKAVLDDPSKTHVDITSNDVHRAAVKYNKGMNMQALFRNEIAYYLTWAAVGIFGAALGAGAIGQMGAFVGALTSAGGLALIGAAGALAAGAIYIKVNNTKIQSEKNMNLGEFEMRRSAKIMAQEIAKELGREPSGQPETLRALPPAMATSQWVERLQAQAQAQTEIASHRVH